MYWCHECSRESPLMPCVHCNSEFCEEMEGADMEEIINPMEMQNPMADLLANLMGHMVRLPNSEENGPVGITIIDGSDRSRRYRRRQRNREGNQNENDENGNDVDDGNELPGDIRNFMAQQMMNQLAELFMQRGLVGRAPNLGDYVVGQGGLDEIITRLMEMHAEENKPPAADEDTLKNLPRLKFSESDEHKECPVCQEDYNVGEETIKLPCKHIFHPDCILNWLKLNGTCPVCRFSLVTEKEEMPPLEPLEAAESSPIISSSSADQENTSSQRQQKRRNDNEEHTDRRTTRPSNIASSTSESGPSLPSSSRVAPRGFEFNFNTDGIIFNRNGTVTFSSVNPSQTSNQEGNDTDIPPQPDVD